MKRLLSCTLALVVIVLSAVSLNGQSGTLTSPKTYASANSVVVRGFTVDDRTQTASVQIVYTTDATGTNEREPARIEIPSNPALPGTEYVDFLTAIGTAAPGETGSVRRRANYRIVHYLCTTAARIQCAAETP